MAGKTVEILKAETLAKLRQPPLNYDRYTEIDILGALNDANLDAATSLKCLHAYAIIILAAGYGQYRPPVDMISPKKAFFYKTPTSYIELTRGGWKSREWLDRYMSGWRTSSSDPYYAYVGDSIGSVRKIGFAPKPKTDGTNYITTPDTGVVISATGMTTSGNIIGVNSSDDGPYCTDCIDSAGRTFSGLGVQVGMMAFNVTDGSKGQISDVTGSTFTVWLDGGATNTWRLGDNFIVLAGEYGVVTYIDSPEQYIFTSNLGELIAINALTGNVYLEYYRQPLELIYDSQYPEIPQELHGILADGAVWKLKRTSARGSEDLNEAMVAKQEFERSIAGYQTVDQATEPNFIRYQW